jgi:hypothetical protein
MGRQVDGATTRATLRNLNVDKVHRRQGTLSRAEHHRRRIDVEHPPRPGGRPEQVKAVQLPR